MTTTQSLLIHAVEALLLLAAMQDIWQLRIANLFSLAIILLFACWVVATGPVWSLWQNALVFLIALALGIGGFAVKWLGGGDVKLIAATALWFDFAGGGALFVYITLAGGMVALLFVIVRWLIPEAVLDRSGAKSLKRKGPIPYGVAIASGAIFALSAGNMNPHSFNLNDLNRQVIETMATKPVVITPSRR